MLELDDVVDVKDVDISMTLSMTMNSNVRFNPQSSRGFVDMTFSNTSISYSFKPVLSIGKSINYTDKYMEMCDIISNHASICSNNTLTWAKIESPHIPLWSNPPVTGRVFGRIFFSLSALLSGELGVELKSEADQVMADFGIRLGGASFISLLNTSNETLQDESSISIKVFGNAKLSGKLGVGIELGLALYDQSVISFNTGIEGYLSAGIIAKGEIGGLFSSIKGGNASIDGDISASADFKIDLYGSLSSELGDFIGINPANILGLRANLYTNNLFNVKQNCGDYIDYHVSTNSCDDIILTYQVDGGSTFNPHAINHFDMSVHFPDGSREDVYDKPYDVYHEMSITDKVQEGDEIRVTIYSVEESCEIIDARYTIPECEIREWIPIRFKSGGLLKLYYVQKDNLRLGGSFGEYYENIPDLGDIYGKLYSWDEVVRPGTTLEGKGACPDRSVVPSVENWRLNILANLESYTSNNPEGQKVKQVIKDESENSRYPTYKYLGANVLKEAAGWFDERDGVPNSILNVYAAGAKFQGSNNGESAFQFLGTSTGFWTSTSVNENDAYAVVFEGKGNDTIYVIPYTKATKLSCRCTKFKF